VSDLLKESSVESPRASVHANLGKNYKLPYSQMPAAIRRAQTHFQLIHTPLHLAFDSSSGGQSRTGFILRAYPALLSSHRALSGEHDRLSIALHKSQLRSLSDIELQRSYEMYLRALQLDEGHPPVAAKVQYFVECWRELRRRRSR